MIPARLQSRKFWVTVLYAALGAGLRAADVDMSDAAWASLAGPVMAYLGIQGYVDSKAG